MAPEHDGACPGIHFFDDGQALQVDALLAQGIAAALEALLDADADALHRGARLPGQVHEAFDGAAVGQEVIDDEHVVRRVQVLFGHNDAVHIVMRERLDFRGVHVGVHVAAGGLFREQHRHPHMHRRQAGHADTRRLDGQDLVDGPVGKEPLELSAQLAEERYIDLVVQETVHLQHIAALDDAVGQNLLLQTPSLN